MLTVSKNPSRAAIKHGVIKNAQTLGDNIALNVEGFVVNSGSSKGISGQVVAGSAYRIMLPARLRLSGPSGWSPSDTDGNEFTATANTSGQFSVLNISGSPITLSNVSVRRVLA